MELMEKIQVLEKREKEKLNKSHELSILDDKAELLMKISELEEQLINAKHLEDVKVSKRTVSQT